MTTTNTRRAFEADLPAILAIYNQGIEDRLATLEVQPKPLEYMAAWLRNREARHVVLVAEREDGAIAGWASINPYNARRAYQSAIYIERDQRGRGVGQQLLTALEAEGREHGFHKFVLFTFPFNALGQGLYRKLGYREVGVFEEQGILDGQCVDVMAMEKILAERDVPKENRIS
ncbi:MAG TPA: arsinothricin resistance N-acetyltransferase ArsN1 family A [Oscillatoriaceae cyanobacterium]